MATNPNDGKGGAFAINGSGDMVANTPPATPDPGPTLGGRTITASDIATPADSQPIACNSASAITLTLLDDTAGWTKGARVSAYQAGAGSVTFVGASGVTVHNADVASSQYGLVDAHRVGANEWVVTARPGRVPVISPTGEMSGLPKALGAAGLQAISGRKERSFVGGASPWSRLYGPNELKNWNKTAELTNTAKFVTPSQPANGPCMSAREGSSVFIDGNLATAAFGGLTCPSISIPGNLAATTIALLVYVHRPDTTANTAIELRIGASGSNYVKYVWSCAGGLIHEGWNVLLTSTSEPVGSSLYGQEYFQSSAVTQNGWRVVGSGHTFGNSISFLQVMFSGLQGAQRPQIWLEGIYVGGKDKPKLTIGFDISNAGGLSLAKASMDKFGLRGYAAAPTANADPNNPQFLWSASDVSVMQDLYNSGWDVVQHSMSHPSMGTLKDDTLIINEMRGGATQIRELGAPRGVDMIATPNASWSNRCSYQAMRLGIRWVRNTVNSPLLISDGLIGSANPYNIGAVGMANIASSTAIKAFVDLMILYGASGNLFTHAIVAGASTSTDTNQAIFEEILEYIKSKVDAGEIDVVTPTEWITQTGYQGLAAKLSPPTRLPVYVGASPWSYVNTAYVPMLVFVSGGTVSALEYSKDGTNFDPIGQVSGAFVVMPGDILRVTYSVAPTVVELAAG